MTATGNNFLAVGPVLAFALAPGSYTFLAFLIVFFFAVVYGLYTRSGSGINQRPYGKIYGGAPGAFGPSSLSGRDERERVDWSRGTR
jgi:hypothetical protein